MRTVAVLATLLALSPLPAAARDLAGVALPDTVTVEGKALQLNGAGIRKKLWVKVYVGALYLAQRASDDAAIVAADAPKQVRMVFLHEVDRKAVLGAFRDGFAANSGAELAQLEPQLARIAPALADMKKGGEIVVTYAPGVGTTVVGPAGTATVEGKPFGDALFRNWLGPKPADADLKRGMLGR